MELVNSTRMVAGYTVGLEPNGRELLVVVVKGTFHLPVDDEPLRLTEDQVPLIVADAFTGAPGFSAPLYEVDFAPHKSRCDVLLNGSAYSPGGSPTSRVEVAVAVAEMKKAFAVLGDRTWRAGARGITPGKPQSFSIMPISYDRAFGGTDTRDDDPAKWNTFAKNPVGVGFHGQLRPDWIDGAPMPNTEEIGRPVDSPHAADVWPMALGPIGRGWEPRLSYAGTYDDAWLEAHFPFLPPDFDARYYQAAPVDQQIAFPQGGEQIQLVNLTPKGRSVFTLPRFDAPVHYFLKNGGREDGSLVLDTIVLEPDQNKVLLTWRATRPLARNIFEVEQVLVGRKPGAWWAAREKIDFPVLLTPVGGE